MQYTSADGLSDEMEALAPYAITIKFVSNDETDADNDDFAVYAQVCGNPVVAVNNLLEPSYTIDVNYLTWAQQKHWPE